MKRRGFLAGAAGAVGATCVALGAVTSASAQGFDRYRDFRYSDRGDREERFLRDRLRGRMFDLSDRIRLCERRGDLPRGRAGNLYRRLDDVRDFLRDDRNLTRGEFERRWDDLNDIARDLSRCCPRYRDDWDYRYYRGGNRDWDRDRDWNRGRDWDRDRDWDDRGRRGRDW